MAQANEGNIGVAADVVNDYGAISRVLELCSEGEAKGDVGKLREAFHADARMFGAIAGERARRHRQLPLARRWECE